MKKSYLPLVNKSLQILLLGLLWGALINCNNRISVPTSPYPISQDNFTAVTIAEGFTVPYGIAIVDDNEYFITDRIGILYHYKDSTLTEIAGMPEVTTFGTPGIRAILHGGLMDIALHPNYKTNAWIYVTYLPIDGFARVSRFQIKDNAAIHFEDIFKTRSQNYFDASTKTLFGVEHGPKGGDEFNVVVKGKNFGWPLFSYGINYDGLGVSTISEDSASTFTVLPEHFWTVPTRDGGQAIGPACLLKVDGSNIPTWNGHFLLGSLAYRRLMKYNRETDETFGLNIEGRVRTIKQLPSGDIIALIERNDLRKSNGNIVRISK